MRKAGYTTLLDPLQEKYGTAMGCVLYLPLLACEILWCATILSSIGHMLSTLLDINIFIAVGIITVIPVIYSIVGGLYSVVYTDALQLLVVFVGLVSKVGDTQGFVKCC